MKSIFAIIFLHSLSYTSNAVLKDQAVEIKQESKKENDLQKLADTLYEKMERKEGILSLSFDSYGDKNKGFYVEKNHPSEKNYLIFHAYDQDGKIVVIKVTEDFKDIESVIVKEIKDTKSIKEVNISTNDKDALLLYKRMVKSSVDYVDEAEIIRHPLLGNFAKYNELIKDKDFASSLENLITKIRL